MDQEINAWEAYEAMSTSYHHKIDTKPHNAFYDRPNTLSLLPKEISDQYILDAGCGPGKYSEILIERGAQVVAIDFSPKMINYAVERNGSDAEFRIHDIREPLDFLANEVLDHVICPLVLAYIEDWNPVLGEFYRTLKPGGSLVVSTAHPFSDYLYFKSENYFQTERVCAEWSGFDQTVDVESFRRSLSKTLMPFIDAGFMLDKILEPLPVPAFKKHDERHYEELMKFPGFLCLRAVKIQ